MRPTAVVQSSLVFAALLLSGCAKPPLNQADMKAAAKRDADAMGAAFLAKDWGKLADLTCPKAVEAAGGRERMIALTGAELQKAETEGFSARAVRMSEPQQLTVLGSNCYTIVSESIEMTAPGGLLKTESYVIGSSTDGGRTWRFVDGAGFDGDATKIRQVVPQFPTELIRLPARKPSVFSPSA